MLFFLGSLAGVRTLKAQDLHYSQFYYSPMNLNPALAGIFNGDVRIMGNFRNQWAAALVDYTTFTGAVDTRIRLNRKSKNFINLGAVFNFDQAGDLDLGLGQLGLNVGYTLAMSDNSFITPGIQLVGQMRSFTFIAQEDNLPEQLEPFNNTNKTDFDLGAGLNWRIQRDDRTKFDFGAAMFHLLRPDYSFGNQGSITQERPIRTSIYGIGSLEVSEKTDLMLRGVGQFQRQNEILLGAAAKFYISKQRGKQIAFEAGGTYRLGDAIFPNFTLYYNDLLVGLSYDINISDFAVSTSNRGGPELAVSYIIRYVKPLKQFKNCPIY